jgi:hypothetical protein
VFERLLQDRSSVKSIVPSQEFQHGFRRIEVRRHRGTDVLHRRLRQRFEASRARRRGMKWFSTGGPCEELERIQND